MDTAEIQKLCENFLREINVPGFVVLGLQTDAAKTQMVYSVREMPLKNVVKGLAFTINDVSGKM